MDKLGKFLHRPYNSYHYQFILNSGAPTSRSYFDLGMENPKNMKDIALFRMMRQNQNRPGKTSGASGLSDSVAMHQRKLRETEMRIDHALDLVTRSFGVNQGIGFPRNGMPKTPEVRRIRQTLERNQRLAQSSKSLSHHNNNNTNTLEGRKNKSHSNGKGMDSTYYKSSANTLSKRKTMKIRSMQGKSKSNAQPHQNQIQNQQQQKPSPYNSTSLKIYRTTPTLLPYTTTVPTRSKRILDKDTIDRNKIHQLCVVTGNTHIYETPNPDFINTFASMDTFNLIDDSNPAGLTRFRTSIDMGGFLNNEISLECDGKKVIINGNRPKKNWVNARKVTETLELPPGVFPEKLRIGRDQQGVLYFEERWAID